MLHSLLKSKHTEVWMLRQAHKQASMLLMTVLPLSNRLQVVRLFVYVSMLGLRDVQGLACNRLDSSLC